jgi:hypothetical protein
MYSTFLLLQDTGILECIASEKEPGQAINAEHKLIKKRFIACYLYEPTP